MVKSTRELRLEYLARAIANALNAIEEKIIDLAYLFSEAKDMFPKNNRGFGAWLKKNDLDRIHHSERAAYIKLGKKLKAGEVTEQQILGFNLKSPQNAILRIEGRHAGYLALSELEQEPVIEESVDRFAEDVRVAELRDPVEIAGPEGPPGTLTPPPLSDETVVPYEVSVLLNALSAIVDEVARRTPEEVQAKVPPQYNAEIDEKWRVVIEWGTLYLSRRRE